MARVTTVTVLDDLDGSKADQTLTFTVNGTNYELDVSKKNAAAFTKAMKPYIDAARTVRPANGRVNGRASTRTGSNRSNTERLSVIRDWAGKNGHQVSARGRIAQAVQDAYDQAQA